MAKRVNVQVGRPQIQQQEMTLPPMQFEAGPGAQPDQGAYGDPLASNADEKQAYMEQMLKMMAMKSASKAKAQQMAQKRKWLNESIANTAASQMDGMAALDAAEANLQASKRPHPKMPRGYVQRSVLADQQRGGEYGETPDGSGWYYSYSGPNAGQLMQVAGMGSDPDMRRLWQLQNESWSEPTKQ